MGLILLIVIAILFFGALPAYPYSRTWGYRPSGLLALILVVFLVLVLLGTIPWGLTRRVYLVNPRPVHVIDQRPVQVIKPAPPAENRPPD